MSKQSRINTYTGMLATGATKADIAAAAKAGDITTAQAEILKRQARS